MTPDPRSQATSPGRIVLLTRPETDSREIASELSTRGIETAIWPLTKIVPEPSPFTIPPDVDGLVFTSQNGVDAMTGVERAQGITAWCVGDRTADAARAAGFGDVKSASGDIGDLVRLLTAQPPMRLFYPRARHVSADLASLLDGTGHSLTSAIVYDAVASGAPPQTIATLLASGRIGVVALWSRRSAAVLMDQITQNPDWKLRQTTAIAISARAAEPLQSAPFANITIASRPDGPAMISAILVAVRQ